MAAEESSSSSSSYPGARAALRETVKWLVAAFASIAAVIVAGSPLSSSSSPNLSGVFFWLSFLFAIGALALVGAALHVTFSLLRPDGLFTSQLCRATEGEAPEITKVRTEINEHWEDLLPSPFRTAAELLDERARTIEALEQSGQPQVDRLAKHLAEVEGALNRLLDFALYQILYARLAKAQPRLFFLGLATLTSLTISVAVAKAVKAEKDESPTILIFQPERNAPGPGPERGLRTDEKMTPLSPVLFQPGSTEIAPAGLEAIEKARAVLSQNEKLVLLLAAHTDTMADAVVNVGLARRRGERVRALLLKQGGVAGGRVFIAELPESALPRLTGDEVREASNRSVDLLVGRLAEAEPPRGTANAIPSARRNH
jgi:outer membrane protein OmpA-like peptidoglycan-associated protein